MELDYDDPNPTRRGWLGPKGYRFVWNSGRQVREHVLVWENYHGRRVPPDHDIHHVNGDRADNRIANLQLLDRATHSRLGTRAEFVNGEWYKTCADCDVTAPIASDTWRTDARGWVRAAVCRECERARARRRRSGRPAHRVRPPLSAVS